MGRTWTLLVVRRGSHFLCPDPLHSSTDEKLTADTFLSFWKQSFLDSSNVWERDSLDKVQAEAGRRGLQFRETDLFARKLVTAAQVQEKGPQRHQQKNNEVDGAKEEERVGLEDTPFSGKGLHKKPSDFIALLKACTKAKNLHRGRELHAHILREGLFKQSILISTTLVSMYSKCGALETAHDVFDEIRARNVVSWNALVAGYIQHEHAQLVLASFQQMQQEGILPNGVTYVYILKACGSSEALNNGKAVHAQLVGNKLLEIDGIVGTALVGMYAKCSLLRAAEETFDELFGRDVVSWNALISGYANHGHGEQAIDCLKRMQHEGLSPNAVTFIGVLKACGSIGAPLKGQALHAEILKEDLLAEGRVGNVLLAMYAKCGVLAKAQDVFDGLLVKDVVSWSTLVTGYALHSRPDEALVCFNQMQQEGLSPNAITFLCLLRACGSMGASHRGQELHAKIVKEGWLQDIRVANALVDMYAKCGALSKAQEVFDELPFRSVVLCTALIAGYAQAGKDDIAIKLCNNMISEGKEPDFVMYTNLLNACSNVGLLEEGQMYFEALREHHGMLPTLEHYACMVDLLARAGHLEKAATLISKMPFSADLAMWHSLLGACQKCGNVKFGRWAFKHAIQLDERDVSSYVIMSNIHETANTSRGMDILDLR